MYGRHASNVTYVVLGSAFVVFIAGAWSSRRSHEFTLLGNDILEQLTHVFSGEGRKDCSLALDELHRNLTNSHPDILNRSDVLPLAIETGGLHGSIYVLYGSIFEFLAVYHAPFRTSGNTGRHFMNTSVYVLSGEVKVWYERAEKTAAYEAGKEYKLRIGQKAIVEMKEDTCLLLYGRGLVPATMWYWVSDSLLRSFDVASAVRIIFSYFKAVYRSTAPWRSLTVPWDSLMGPLDYLRAFAAESLPEFWDDTLSIFSSFTYTIHNFLSSLLMDQRSAVAD